MGALCLGLAVQHLRDQHGEKLCEVCDGEWGQHWWS